MKLQLKSLLIFLGASFILFTGFKSAGLRDAQILQANGQSSPVSIRTSFTGGAFPTLTGTFTTNGAIETSGDIVMDMYPNVSGIRSHFVLTLVSSNGTITIHQNCVFSNLSSKGNWKIVNGTGAYTNLKGNGSVLMLPFGEEMEGDISKN